jgi:hypothetical protein
MEEKRPRQRKEDGQFLCGPLRFFVTSVLSFSGFGLESRESTRLSALLPVTIFARRTHYCLRLRRTVNSQLQRNSFV